MKDYSTLPNTTGAFPNVAAQNATGPGETDGTPYVKQFIDDLWGARQALMDRAGIVPDGVQEAPGASQFLDALATVIRKSSVRAKNWKRYIQNATSTDSFRDFAYAHEIAGIEQKMWVGVGQQTASTGIWSCRGGKGWWIPRTNPSATSTLYGVVWDSVNGLFVAVGAAAGGDAAILTSPDGITWTERTNPKSFNLRGIAVDDSGLFVAVGNADGTDAYIVTSPDGITWTERSNPKNFTLEAITWSKTLNLFIAIGASDGSDTYLITSPDGITWTERSNPANSQFNAISAGDSIIVAFDDSNTCLRSPDGITWTAFNFPNVAGEEIECSVWSEELKLFVVPFTTDVTNGGMAIGLSEDGINWDVVFIDLSGNTTDFTFYGIGAGKENLVGGGVSGSIATSQNW